MEPKQKRHDTTFEVSHVKPAAQRTTFSEPVQSLVERVIEFVDARLHIEKEKAAPEPMRKAG